MRQQPIQHNAGRGTEFKVIRGSLAESTSLPVSAVLVQTAWTFAKTALWNCQQFSSKECEQAKVHIARYLCLFRNPRKGFMAFCQRIIIARQFLEAETTPLQTLPSSWLDRKQPSGFSLTKGLYKDLRLIRERLPAYERELKALAEAVLDFSESPSVRNYRYWTNYFIDRNKPELLNLFQLFGANFLYSK